MTSAGTIDSSVCLLHDQLARMKVNAGNTQKEQAVVNLAGSSLSTIEPRSTWTCPRGTGMKVRVRNLDCSIDLKNVYIHNP